MDNQSESDADLAPELDQEAPAPAPKRTVATVVITDNYISHELAAPRPEKQTSL